MIPIKKSKTYYRLFIKNIFTVIGSFVLVLSWYNEKVQINRLDNKLKRANRGEEVCFELGNLHELNNDFLVLFSSAKDSVSKDAVTMTEFNAVKNIAYLKYFCNIVLIDDEQELRNKRDSLDAFYSLLEVNKYKYEEIHNYFVSKDYSANNANDLLIQLSNKKKAMEDEIGHVYNLSLIFYIIGILFITLNKLQNLTENIKKEDLVTALLEGINKKLNYKKGLT